MISVYSQDAVCIVKFLSTCWQVVERQSKKVFHSEAFFEISKDTLCRLLRMERLSVHEIDVFRACLHWAERRASLLNLALTPANKRQVGCRITV